jgi:hypothetical protein
MERQEANALQKGDKVRRLSNGKVLNVIYYNGAFNTMTDEERAEVTNPENVYHSTVANNPWMFELVDKAQ